MQIAHKINDFLYTIFPQLELVSKEEVTNTIRKYYTFVPFVPTVTLEENLIIIDLDTETISTQDADYNQTVSLCDKGKFDDAKIILEKLINKNPTNSDLGR